MGKLSRVLALIVLGLGLVPVAHGQPYPNKPVRIVVPFAAGSATDIIARIIADELRGSLGQSFLVDNRPGASAQIGAELVARSPADGYTLFVTTNTSHSANPFLFKKLNYDPIKDFAPVANIMRIPVIVVVNPKTGVNSLQELIAYAKANPGKVSFGYGNSIGQVVGASIAKRTGLDVITVPYKSTPQAITDVLAGQITYSVADMASAQAFVKDGRLRALGVSSAKRSSLMPELPAIAETAGLEAFEVIAWVAMFAPAGAPKDIVDRLNGAVRTALTKPEVRERIASFNAEVASSTPEELGAFVKDQLASWGKSIKEAGIQPE
ncbi:MAG TPA: tripartite tricarboxylate transporter substrate binding protein [Casimicrobiaceae bacterium]|nr:tripartite tricarboxylate transporter substrate binding protein [Casimicrobiaceae bacterium]